jgi:hypothetical protein
MKYVEAPNTIGSLFEPSIFLAGAISGAEEWQTNLVDKLKDTNIVIFNPRRKNFPIHDPSAAEAQITWEFHHLIRASIISFWFSKETLGPIVLFELGAHLKDNKPILIGMDPKYQRRQDVEIQTRLVRPEITIVYSLDDLSKQIKNIV